MCQVTLEFKVTDDLDEMSSCIVYQNTSRVNK